MAGKVIIVTGASRGIGYAIAQYLLDNAHKVLLVSRSEEELRNLAEKYPEQAEYTTGDLTNTDVRGPKCQSIPLAVTRSWFD
jgi:NADP-dependent 3-hydroxy acid dehydrogenase YdfG